MMEFLSAWYILPLALALDLAAGDPARMPHPVRLMGWAADRLEPVCRNLSLPLKQSGILYAAILVVGSYLATLMIVIAAIRIHPVFGLIVQVVIVYTCLAARCLYDEAARVYAVLVSGDIDQARKQIGMLVSRDVSGLHETGVVRAAVETVAENFVDGVLSPLFYAAILGAPGAVAFKMASTLDSMVGYKNERYIDFGKASARLDDILNWIPARLSVPVIAAAARLVLGTGKQAFKTAVLEGANHQSPNAGKPEAAFAGALGVKINGPNIYHGKLLEKPWIGVGFPPPGKMDIIKAGRLMIVSAVISVAILTICVIIT